MSQLVIFLDVDGVLVTPDRLGLGKENSLSSPFRHQARIDPDAVDRLGQIVARTDAVIVVSSTWRNLAPEMGGLRRAFDAAGFHRDLIVGITPTLSHDRPLEITTWLQAHPEVTAYVVIDDGVIDGHPQVLTCWANANDGGGLQAEHVTQAVEILLSPDALELEAS